MTLERKPKNFFGSNPQLNNESLSWSEVFIRRYRELSSEYRNKGLHWEADLFAEIAEDFISLTDERGETPEEK